MKILNKKILPFFLVLLLVASVFGALSFVAPIQANAATTGVVTDGPLNVRSGPGTTYSIIGSLNKGNSVTINGTSTASNGVKWHKISYGQKTGYVSSQFVKVQATTTTPKATYTAYSPKKQGVTLSNITVHKSPSTGAATIGRFVSGTTLKLDGLHTTADGVKWYRVYTNGQTGYILEKNVRLGTTSPTTPEATYTAYSPKKQGVTLSNITVHKSPSTGAATIGRFVSGTTLKLDGLHTTADGVKWYRVYTNGQTGYILEKNVRLGTTSPTTPEATYTAYSPKKQGVALSNMTVHKSPSTGAATIGRFVSGTTLKLDGLHTTADGVKWYRVYTNGQTGYILEKNVRLGTTSPTTPEATYIAYSPKKQGVTLSNITVHKSPSTGAATIGRFVSGALLKLDGLHTTADGVKWYQVYTNGQKGYILAKNVDTSNIVTDSDFEAMLTKQKFPESYKPYLRNIHKKHPTWSFTALHTGMSWSTVQTKEQRLGNNLVEPTVPDSWKSKKPGAYNPKTGVYTKFDGRWNQAGDHVIAYYMDPRNFLNDSEIFQFMDHYFYTSMSKKEYISKIVSGSFMNSSLYINSLYNAGSKVGVNPNVLAAMVIMEQGWNGSSLCSGKYPGYEGYYNHFNIGAYTAGGMSAVQRGLWYAKGSGIGSTTYGRPWNTIERSLAGGVQFYASGYVKKNQYTYYLKKFNVMNGPANVATHEYMTNVQGAYGEGMLLKRAYTNVEAPLVFRIPVYTNMPSKPAPKP